MPQGCFICLHFMGHSIQMSNSTLLALCLIFTMSPDLFWNQLGCPQVPQL